MRLEHEAADGSGAENEAKEVVGGINRKGGKEDESYWIFSKRFKTN